MLALPPKISIYMPLPCSQEIYIYSRALQPRNPEQTKKVSKASLAIFTVDEFLPAVSEEFNTQVCHSLAVSGSLPTSGEDCGRMARLDWRWCCSIPLREKHALASSLSKGSGQPRTKSFLTKTNVGLINEHVVLWFSEETVKDHRVHRLRLSSKHIFSTSSQVWLSTVTLQKSQDENATELHYILVEMLYHQSTMSEGLLELIIDTTICEMQYTGHWTL